MLEVVEKTWDEFWAYYWRVTARHRIPGIREWDEKLVDFIEEVCFLSSSDRVLDLACGGGDQAMVLARRGYEVVGIDIAPSLVEHARDQFAENDLRGEFFVGDMREISYREEFDVVLILSGSFGFFGPEEDAELLNGTYRALRPGGRVFVMFTSANMEPFHERTWHRTEEGFNLVETWFDSKQCVRRSRPQIITEEGRIIKPKTQEGYHADEAIHCYTVPQMTEMLEGAGFEGVESFSEFSEKGQGTAPPNIMYAERG